MIINKIYHLADLHIRNLQRHKEYKEVFKKFLKQVEDDKIEDSIIYLAGDIAHAKTEMSPELIREISWFLTECSKLRETFLITGNHDCNLNNNHRLDVLIPLSIILIILTSIIYVILVSTITTILLLLFIPYWIRRKIGRWRKILKGKTKSVFSTGR
jgi:DNA repair exonuclease SbcCD nuclease subunit